MAEQRDSQTVASRVETLQERLGYRNQAAMAAEIKRLVGTGTTQSRITGWKKGDNPEGLALLSLLHPTDPRGCLEWLRGAREDMPEVPGRGRFEATYADLGDAGLLPPISGEKALEVVSQMCGLLRVTGACPKKGSQP